jgi:hypothetical protein
LLAGLDDSPTTYLLPPIRDLLVFQLWDILGSLTAYYAYGGVVNPFAVSLSSVSVHALTARPWFTFRTTRNVLVGEFDGPTALLRLSPFRFLLRTSFFDFSGFLPVPTTQTIFMATAPGDIGTPSSGGITVALSPPLPFAGP